MKLLLLTVVSYIAQGTCLAGSATNGATNSAAANVVCTGACAAAITATAANAAAATLRKCADGYTGTPEAAVCPGDGTSATDATGGLAWSGCTVIACTPNTSTATGCKTCILIADRTAGADQCLTCNAGSFLAAKACTACTKPTGTTTATCTAATDLTTVDCGAAYYETPAVTGVDAVTRVCLPEATGATTSTPGVAGVTFVTASCTACAGEQTGCAASTATTCSTGTAIQNLQCTRTSTGYSLTGSLVTKCSQVGVATYTAATASISGDCVALTCSTGYTKSGDAGSIVCTANACTATAVTEGYTAAGLPLVTGVDYAAATGSAAACPATTVVAMVPAVEARLAAAVVLAKDALNVADVGTVACATGYTAAAAGAAATCPTAAGPIVYTGCSKAVAAPASAAQTMIACVLAVVAMYL